MSFRLARRKLRPLEWMQKCWMHFYCFLVKEITKWAETFTGWFYYISLDSYKVWKQFTDTLPMLCMGFKVNLIKNTNILIHGLQYGKKPGQNVQLSWSNHNRNYSWKFYLPSDIGWKYKFTVTKDSISDRKISRDDWWCTLKNLRCFMAFFKVICFCF